MHRIPVLTMLMLCTAWAQAAEIEAVTLHPPVAARMQCSEHALGAEDHVPDALGADCVLVSWGHNDLKRLESAGLPVAHSVEALENILAKS